MTKAILILARCTAGRNDGQRHIGRPIPFVKDLLAGNRDLAVFSELVTGVRVAIVLREVAAGYLNSNFVPLQKHVTECGPVTLLENSLHFGYGRRFCERAVVSSTALPLLPPDS